MAVLKTKTFDLIDQLNLIDRSLELSNPFAWRTQLRSVQIEAEQLLSVDVVSASVVLGMLACLKHDHEEMRAKHINAIRNAPGSDLVYYNYAQSLCFAGFYTEAYEYYERAIKLEPSLVHYASAIQNYILAFRWDLAAQTFERLQRLRFDIPENLQTTVAILSDALNTYGIPAEIFAAMKLVADDFLRSKGIHMTANINCRRYANDGDFIYWPIWVTADEAIIQKLNYEFADVLASKFDDIHSDKIVLTFEKAP